MFKKGAVIDSKNFEHNCKYFQINKDYWVYILYNMQCVGNVSTPDSVWTLRIKLFIKNVMKFTAKVRVFCCGNPWF